MKFGFRAPSLKKRISDRTSPTRLIKNYLGLKAPKGMGWLTNPKKAAYNKVYDKTTKGCLSIFIVPLIFAYLISSFFSCSTSTEHSIEKPNIPTDVECHITKNVIDKGDDRYLINVEINKVVDERTIKSISDYIKSTNTAASNMRMFFMIKGVGRGAWARVDYLPDYELDILGPTAQESKNLEDASIQDINEAEIIGKWKDLTSFSVRTLIIYKKEKKLFIRWFYEDKSYDDVNLKKQNDKYKVVNRNGYDEWYVIESNGNLGTYSCKGKFSEAAPIK